MKFPIAMMVERGRYGGGVLRMAWRGWNPPKADDESAWTGKEYWGEGISLKETIEDAASQIEYNKGIVYICVNYNSKAVAKQRLRLYISKKAAGASAFRCVTKPIDKEQRIWLFKNEGLYPWLRSAVEIEEIVEHPFLRMMKEVSPILNQADLWMLTETFMGLTGNCYWWMRPNALGEPYQLWVLETQKTKPVLGETLDEFIVGYVYYQGLERVPYDADSVVHHKYPNPDSKVIGLSPVQALSDPVIVNENIYRYERAQFKNMARPDGVIEIDKDATLGDKEFRRLKREWKKTYGGVAKSGQVAILEGGKYKKVSMTPRELSHLEGKKMTLEEVAAGYGIPAALLMPDPRVANILVAYKQYMRDTVDPKLKLYEQKINEQLLPAYKGGENLFCAFDNCIPEDREFLLKEKEFRLKSGYSSINIERAADGEEEVDWGGVPILPMAMVPFGEAPKKGEKPKKELADEVARKIFERLKRQ